MWCGAPSFRDSSDATCHPHEISPTCRARFGHVADRENSWGGLFILIVWDMYCIKGGYNICGRGDTRVSVVVSHPQDEAPGSPAPKPRRPAGINSSHAQSSTRDTATASMAYVPVHLRGGGGDGGGGGGGGGGGRPGGGYDSRDGGRGGDRGGGGAGAYTRPLLSST